jgi:hypothetical protein
MSWGQDGIPGHQAGAEGQLRAGVRMAFLGIKQVLRVSYELVTMAFPGIKQVLRVS